MFHRKKSFRIHLEHMLIISCQLISNKKFYKIGLSDITKIIPLSQWGFSGTVETKDEANTINEYNIHG